MRAFDHLLVAYNVPDTENCGYQHCGATQVCRALLHCGAAPLMQQMETLVDFLARVGSGPPLPTPHPTPAEPDDIGGTDSQTVTGADEDTGLSSPAYCTWTRVYFVCW